MLAGADCIRRWSSASARSWRHDYAAGPATIPAAISRCMRTPPPPPPTLVPGPFRRWLRVPLPQRLLPGGLSQTQNTRTTVSRRRTSRRRPGAAAATTTTAEAWRRRETVLTRSRELMRATARRCGTRICLRRLQQHPGDRRQWRPAKVRPAPARSRSGRRPRRHSQPPCPARSSSSLPHLRLLPPAMFSSTLTRTPARPPTRTRTRIRTT